MIDELAANWELCFDCHEPEPDCKCKLFRQYSKYTLEICVCGHTHEEHEMVLEGRDFGSDIPAKKPFDTREGLCHGCIEEGKECFEFRFAGHLGLLNA